MLSKETNLQTDRHFDLTIVQQPDNGCACGDDTRDRVPLDPPFIVQLVIRDGHGNELPCGEDIPFLVAHVSLWSEDGSEPRDIIQSAEGATRLLLGSSASSVNTCADPESELRQASYFVFGDLSVRVSGKYRLGVSLANIKGNLLMRQGPTTTIASVLSEAFVVKEKYEYTGFGEPTPITIRLASQGVRSLAGFRAQ
ncbi:hypothetical protein K493DRAFT_65468 [Basidiobolus meristosporus CBS 931.73]|uniref:Velvet domain-containing protein n=1 Tax=Basidiobolus meristosporus CBS 931.73 TaxID=1314790 RepID=A0A1Y1XVN6_9FUNG|nr:hypothetical protein K493DRAFT_65468 [Basidiobolus meristosporus CBS 931.73]|eukprot:ORX89783.1 hypothetical protein K493DRAFT_65468 [Basidiobolus meristosporus CBS 931.73]